MNTVKELRRKNSCGKISEFKEDITVVLVIPSISMTPINLIIFSFIILTLYNL